MEFLQNVIRRKHFDDERYRLVQCAELAVRQIELDGMSRMTHDQATAGFALSPEPHLYLRSALSA